MHKTENKSIWKEEMSYGGDNWYMGRKLCLHLANFRLHN